MAERARAVARVAGVMTSYSGRETRSGKRPNCTLPSDAAPVARLNPNGEGYSP